MCCVFAYFAGLMGGFPSNTAMMFSAATMLMTSRASMVASTVFDSQRLLFESGKVHHQEFHLKGEIFACAE
jgi:hypothetical protein